jgi:hypothetical protein
MKRTSTIERPSRRGVNGERHSTGYRGERTSSWGPKPDWTPHAKQRRRQMGLTEHRVEVVYHEPELTYPSHDNYTVTIRRECRQKGDIVVVVEGTQIITVLWHLKEGRDA